MVAGTSISSSLSSVTELSPATGAPEPTEHVLTIGGREVSVASDASREHMRIVEALVNERVLASGLDEGVPLTTALLLATLNLADELIRERTRHQALKEKIRSRSTVLLERLEAVAGPRSIAA